MQVLIIDESMTKKKGFILERIADDGNLRLAIKNSQRGGKAKRRSDIRAVNADIDATVERLRAMILNLDFPEHRSRVVNRKADSGKMRRLDDEDYMPWKIMSHAIMQVIEPVINGKMIADTSSCIKGRGNLYGGRRMKRLLRRYPDHTWTAKSDCKKYYQGLDHGYMLRVLRHHFKDERFIRLMEICVLDYYCGEVIEKEIEDEREKKAGVRIGAYISGMIGNLAHMEIDHILTERYGVKLERNCDDMVMLARTKGEARFLLNAYDRLAEERGMTVKANSYYAPILHYEKKRHRRKRQRGTGHRLPRICVLEGGCEASQGHKETLRSGDGARQKQKEKKTDTGQLQGLVRARGLQEPLEKNNREENGIR